MADTTKGIHDRVSIDILDQPSIETRSTLNQHYINTVVDNRSSVHLICRKFSESLPGQRHATDSRPVDRMAADMPTESRSRVNREYRSTLDHGSL